ncbi:MAG: hypothetical protein R2683_03095 [Bifidobacterium adolescentis]
MANRAVWTVDHDDHQLGLLQSAAIAPDQRRILPGVTGSYQIVGGAW